MKYSLRNTYTFLCASLLSLCSVSKTLNAQDARYSKHEFTINVGAGLNALQGVGVSTSFNYTLMPERKFNFESNIFLDHFYGDGFTNNGNPYNNFVFGVGAGMRAQFSPMSKKWRWSGFIMGQFGLLTDDKNGDFSPYLGPTLGITAKMHNKHSISMGNSFLMNLLFVRYGYTF